VVANGVEYEVDCIIFATGFEVGTAYTRRAGFEVYGRGGLALSDHWADGLKTLHGFYSHGFPNCFHLGVTQNALTANFPHMLDEQVRHVATLIGEASARQARRIEPTAEGEADWVNTIRTSPQLNQEFRRECTPGYYNGEGAVSAGNGIFDELYGAGPVVFYDLVRAWREDGAFKGLEFA